jgi:hypothetical protein
MGAEGRLDPDDHGELPAAISQTPTPTPTNRATEAPIAVMPRAPRDAGSAPRGADAATRPGPSSVRPSPGVELGQIGSTNGQRAVTIGH